MLYHFRRIRSDNVIVTQLAQDSQLSGAKMMMAKEVARHIQIHIVHLQRQFSVSSKNY